MAASQEKLVEALRTSLMDNERLRQENDRLLARSTEPIAIISMSCRLPGGVSSPEQLWQLLSEGRDAIGGFPTDRGWDLDSLFDPDPDHVGTSYTHEGGFLHDAGAFDADFFGISPREAMAMDPQQRQLLETAWETLENAGINPLSLQSSDIGVFAGGIGQGYGGGLGGAPEELEGYLVVGSAASVISGRVAYTLGLVGPAITVDTACSSSLVAIHLAVQALRNNECAMALAGGVTIMGQPAGFVEFSRQRGLAPDGRCKSFSDTADGTVWSEGVGLVLLERLSDAQRNGHDVLAVVRGSAINQDGASNGLTAPSGPSQQRVIRQALANAGLAVSDVDAVEAHGTGTTLGDPIEAQALLATYGQGRPADRPLWLGSIKSNIGHTSAAAGVIGVIKMVQAIRQSILPQTLHIDQPTTKVDWSTGMIQLLTDHQPWPDTDHPRRAGVSSFGVSGTNAHLILEQAPEPTITIDTTPPATAEHSDTTGIVGSPGVVPWLLSGKTPQALQAQAQRLLAHLNNPKQQHSLIDVGWSLATTRAALEHRAVVLATDRDHALTATTALAAGGSHRAVVVGSTFPGRIAVMFTGQGSQKAGMGRELHATYPAFARAFDAVRAELDKQPAHESGVCVADVVFAQEGSKHSALLDQTAFTQPALFAVEVALFRLLESWGIRPDFVMGHSIGELVAAHVAGVLSLTDACTLVSARGRLMQTMPTTGVMIAIEATEDEVVPLLADREPRVGIAAINSPTSVVLSGDKDTVLAITDEFDRRGRKTKQLRVSHAFHSPHMDGMLDVFTEVAAQLSFAAPRIPVVSNLTGQIADTSSLCSPQYWATHLRGTVRFLDSIRTLNELGANTFLELGPGGVLTSMAQDCLPEPADNTTFIPTLRNDAPETHTAMAALAQLHVHGVPVNWATLFTGTGGRRVPLPTYAFQHQHYWLQPTPTPTGDLAAVGLRRVEHPLLGALTPLPDTGGMVLSGRVSLSTHPWLADHVVSDTVLLPGTAMVDLALRAGDETDTPVLHELIITQPMVVPDHHPLHLHVLLTTLDTPGAGVTTRGVRIYSQPEGDQHWTEHATGILSAHTPTTPDSPDSPWAGVWPPAGSTPVDLRDFYPGLAQAGYHYGPAFQGLTTAWIGDGEVFAEVSLPIEHHPHAGRFGIHPALLDAALHATNLCLPTNPDQPLTLLPFAWTNVRLHATGATTVRVQAHATSADTLTIRLLDTTGTPVATIDALTLREITTDQLNALTPTTNADSLWTVSWTPHTPTTPKHPTPHLIHYTSIDTLPPHTTDNISSTGIVIADTTTWTNHHDDLPTRTRVLTTHTLRLLQHWVSTPELATTHLVLLTHGAVAVHTDTEVSDPAAAAIWGLVRSAQSEHPDRFSLIDTDNHPTSRDLLPTTATDPHPQQALRAGTTHTPQLTPTPTPGSESGSGFGLDPNGTVLITGGTGTLGALAARHLVTNHNIRHLVLISRRGPHTPHAQSLRTDLSTLGAQVSITACDVTDRDQLATVLAAIPTEHPLTGIIHTAGTLDDGILTALTPERINTVLQPKADAAIHLHELTQHTNLALFAVYSSAAGILGSPGQANYAAANAFLDALMQHRRATGLPATSLAWGLWTETSDLTSGLAASDRERMRRSGVLGLSSSEALHLFDRGVRSGRSTVVPLKLDLTRLRSDAPPLLRGLVRSTRRSVQTPPTGTLTLADRLASQDITEQERTLTELVRTEAAAVLGHPTKDSVDPAKAFQDIGFDSLTAVELRNRLNTATGLRLPATIVFDHPSPLAAATYLRLELLGQLPAITPPPPPASKPDTTTDPIAVVGMACRAPGGVHTPEQLWELVIQGRDAISNFPTDRGWDLDTLFDPDPDHTGTSYTHEGGFLHHASRFDADFFGISPREAMAMDPQQRQLLETAWETLENAGINPRSVHGSDIGVFSGLMYHDYGTNVSELPAGSETYLSTGTSASVVSGRIAYSLGLVGPAITVDTACSSSLVAIHWAMTALREGECGMALAGGVTVMATPGAFVGFSRQRGLAADGRCKSFAEGADGTVWSEGVGLVLLERLSDAQRNGHDVLAVVRGSAINQDGASNGLTAPNGPSQQRVIQLALASAGVAAEEVDAVEAHGTGTTLGDPIEAQALINTYGHHRPPTRPLWLGSIKSNIGHTQAAAGVIGVIKMVQAIRHGILPQTLHIDQPTTKVDWSTGTIQLLTDHQPWPNTDRPRRAGVSSFGVSGTNAHLILEQAPQPHTETTTTTTPPATTEHSDTTSIIGSSGVVPWLLSGKTPQALQAQAQRLLAHLNNPKQQHSLIDVGWSLATTRAALEHRAVILATNHDHTLTATTALARGEPSASVITGQAGVDGKTVFVFPGQGAQWAGMGHDLLAQSPVFAARMHDCAQALAPYVDWSLLDIITGATDTPSLDRVEVVQPVSWAVMVSLAAVWQSCGITPDAVLGHSQGEIAAAAVAGVLSLPDAARLVTVRSQAIATHLSGHGGMMSVLASKEWVREAITDWRDRLCIAAVNSPAAVVIAGDPETLREWGQAREAQGMRIRTIPVDYASHTAHVDAIQDQLHRMLADIPTHPPNIPWLSTTDTHWIDPTTLDADYWFRNLRNTVEFEAATRALIEQGYRVFIEVSTHPVLTTSIQDTLETTPGATAVVTGTLRRDDGGTDRIITALAQLHVHGVPVNWATLFTGTGGRRVPLPTYAFQRQRFWLRPVVAAGDLAGAGLTAVGHPLLSAVVPVPDTGGVLLSGRVSLSTHPWLADHAVLGVVLVPGTAIVEAVIRAGDEVGAGVVEELVIGQPLVLPESSGVRVQVLVGGAGQDGWIPPGFVET